MEQASAAGDLERVIWLHHHSEENVTTAAMDAAAEYGHLHVVRWLHENRKEGCRCRTSLLPRRSRVNFLFYHSATAMDYAAANNHLDVLTWLHAHRREGCTADAFVFAAIYGHLDVMKWLHEQKLVQSVSESDDEPIVLAAEHGHLHIVEWLLDHGYGECKTSIMAIRFAALNGHASIVEYLLSKGFAISYADLIASSYSGNMETVSLILRIMLQRNLSWSYIDVSDIYRIVMGAANEAKRAGHRLVAEYLEDQSKCLVAKHRAIERMMPHVIGRI